MLRLWIGIQAGALVAALGACSTADGPGFMDPDGSGSGSGSSSGSGPGSSSGGRRDGGSSGSGSSSGSSGSSSGGSTSSGSSSSGSGDGGTSPDKACTDLATSLCSKLASCAPAAIPVTTGDLATCIARTKLVCPALYMAPGTGGSPSSAEACAQAYTTASCDDVLGNKYPSGCVVSGKQATGAPCGADGQCSPSDYCNLTTTQICGVCTQRVAAGGTCTLNDNCQFGMVCAYATNATTGNCVVPGGQSATCDTTHPCLATLGCAANGKCGPYLMQGAPCTVQNCDVPHGLFCNPVSHACEQAQTVGPGSMCGYATATGAYSVCLASARCALPSASSTVGTCEATAMDGKSCDLTNGPHCFSPAYCAAGVCVLPSATCQ
jgi:hypothetical protein